jgi:hypothetical protein
VSLRRFFFLCKGSRAKFISRLHFTKAMVCMLRPDGNGSDDGKSEAPRLCDVIDLLYEAVHGQVWERLFLEPLMTVKDSVDTKTDFVLRLADTVVDERRARGLTLVLSCRRPVMDKEETKAHIPLSAYDLRGPDLKSDNYLLDRHGQTHKNLDFLFQDLANYCHQWDDCIHAGDSYVPE